MKHVLIYSVALVLGVLLAGAVAAALLPVLPSAWRGAPTLWVITLTVIALTMTGFWLFSEKRR